LDKWLNLRDLVEETLQKGVIDRVREQILCRHYGQGNLQLIATSRDA